MASVVDRISLHGPVYSFEVFNDSLYCMGETISRIALPSKTFTVIAPGMSAIWSTVVDFHRPIDVGEDIVGHGAPDRRIYVVCTDRTAPDGGIGAIVPALGDQFTWNRAYQSDEGSPYDPTSLPSIYSIAAAPSAKYLYIHDIGALTIAALDLGDPEPHVVASIDVNSYVPNMVISPDDRFIYAANPTDDTVRVIDTASWPPSTRKVTVANGPYGLALSVDGKRLFVTGSGWGPNPLGTGTLSVLDTETMQETQIDIGGGHPRVRSEQRRPFGGRCRRVRQSRRHGDHHGLQIPPSRTAECRRATALRRTQSFAKQAEIAIVAL